VAITWTGGFTHASSRSCDESFSTPALNGCYVLYVSSMYPAAAVRTKEKPEFNHSILSTVVLVLVPIDGLCS